MGAPGYLFTHSLTCVSMQALEVPMRMGVKQGIMQGITVGTTNCVFLCSYALAFWYGSTRVRAGKYDGRPLLALMPIQRKVLLRL